MIFLDTFLKGLKPRFVIRHLNSAPSVLQIRRRRGRPSQLLLHADDSHDHVVDDERQAVRRTADSVLGARAILGRLGAVFGELLLCSEYVFCGTS